MATIRTIYKSLKYGQSRNLRKIEMKKAIKKQQEQLKKQKAQQVERRLIQQRRIERRIAKYERRKLKARQPSLTPKQKSRMESQLKPEILFEQYQQSRKPHRPYEVRETGIA